MFLLVSCYRPIGIFILLWFNLHLIISFQLPWEIFFICGDSSSLMCTRIVGQNLCSVGKLRLLAPSVEMKHKSKRCINQCKSDCKNYFEPERFGKRLSASLFLPQLSSAVALKQLDWLGCWLSKELNSTSFALSEMLSDVKSEICDLAKLGCNWFFSY